MQNCFPCWSYIAVLAVALLGSNARSAGAEALNWNTNQNRVSADIQSMPVARLLVYREPVA